MILHTFLYIVVRVPNAFFGFPEASVFMYIILVLGYILQYGLMLYTAVILCVKFDKKCQLS